MKIVISILAISCLAAFAQVSTNIATCLALQTAPITQCVVAQT